MAVKNLFRWVPLPIPMGIALALAAQPASAAITYAVTDIAPLPGTVSAQATSINDQGQVVGVSDTSVAAGPVNRYGFIWQQTGTTNLGQIGSGSGANLGNVSGINNLGQVVGARNNQATVWVNGVATPIAGVPLLSTAVSINDAGQIAGQLLNVDGTTTNGFISQNGAVTVLPQSSSAFANNQQGQVVVRLADGTVHLWSNGAVQQPALAGLAGTTPQGINRLGQITGFDVATGLPYFWSNAAGRVNLPQLLGSGPVQAYGINNIGQIVGFSNFDICPDFCSASLWYFDGNQWQVRDLNAISNAGAGFNLAQAFSINNQGQIVGEANNSNGNIHGFLATPTGTLSWVGGSGQWDNPLNWDSGVGLAPVRTLDIVINPNGQGLTVQGPSLDGVVNSLQIGGNGGGTATLTLNAGGLTVSQGTMVLANGVLVNQSTLNLDGPSSNAGILNNQGTLNIQNSLTNSAGGTLANAANSTLTNNGTLANAGTASNAGTLNNQGSLNNQNSLNNLAGGTLSNAANSTLANSGTLTNQGTASNAGSLNNQGTLNNQNSLANLAGGTLTNAANSTVVNSGTLANQGTVNNAGRLDNRASFNNPGALNNSGVISNAGGFNLSNGGQVYGTGVFTNTSQGTVTITGAGPHLFEGNVTNEGSFKTTDTHVIFTGDFANNGRYESDPSTNQFNNLSVGPNGYLVGGAGDTFIVTGNFINASTQNTLWNTSQSSLVFSSPNGQPAAHIMQLAGVDRGANPSGATNNFAWGSVTLATGNTLTLTSSNNNPSAALYASRIVLPNGISQLGGISSNYNVYFDPTLPENNYLLGGLGFGNGIGRLLPWSFSPFSTDLLNDSGLTPNQQGFAAALNEACSRPSGVLASRCLELQALGTPQKKFAITSLTPDQVPGQTAIPIKFTATRMTDIFSRLSTLRAGGGGGLLSFNFNGVQLPMDKLAKSLGLNPTGGSTGDPDEPFRDSPLSIYLQARFNFGNQGDNPWVRSFNFQSRNFMLGADYRLSDQLIAGLAFTYINTASDYGQAAGRMSSDSYLGTFYGSYYLPKDFYVDWLANVGGNNYSFNRQFAYPGFQGQTNSSPSGMQYGFAISSGKDFNWQEWTVGPYARLEYVNLNIGAYQEKGGLGFNTTVGGQTNHSFVSDLGAQISHAVSLPWGVITPALRFEWEHQYLNDNQAIQMRLSDASPGLGYFVINTGKPDRDYFNLGGSVSATLANGGSGFVRYETRLGQSNISEHIVEAGVRLTF